MTSTTAPRPSEVGTPIDAARTTPIASAPMDRTSRTGPDPFAPVPASAFASCLLLVLAVVVWRSGEFYTGGLDYVVVAKGLLTALAFVIAILGRATTRTGSLAVSPVLWLGSYLALSVIAAMAGELTLSSLILAARLALTASVIAILVSKHGAMSIFSSLTKAMLVVAFVACATGAGTLASGRLSGGVPAATPNEISILCCVPLVVLMWRWVTGCASNVQLAAAAVLIAVVWLTGSRTGLVVLLAAAALTFALTRKIAAGAFCGLVLAMPAAVYVVLGTSALAQFLGRGGTESVTTLNSRTIAWNAALHLADDFWSRWFGAGLALKKIPVPARYWSEQGLDSTWFGALVQVGWVGVALLSAWVVVLLWRAGSNPYRALWLPLLAMIAARSFLESGMFDSSATFLGFWLGAIGVYATSQPDREEQEAPS